jgi:hypothetical protein
VTLPRFPEADLALAAETLTAIGNDAPAELRELCKNRFLSTGSIERLGRWLNAYVGSAGCTQE